MRIVVTGAAGMLGSALVRAWADDHDVRAVIRESPVRERAGDVEVARWDVTQPADPGLGSPADVWVHCAAFTSVDGAERDPDTASRVNVEGTARVAEIARSAGARLVYVSTDSVFDGRRGHYTEQDPVSPVNVYARTKVEAERIVHDEASGLVVRTNLVAPDQGLTRWLLETARRGGELRLFRDVVFNPLPVSSLPEMLLKLLDVDAVGTVHLGSREILTKAQYGRLALARAGLRSASVREVDLAEAGLPAPRPLDTSLCTLEARRLGLDPPSIERVFEQLDPGEEAYVD